MNKQKIDKISTVACGSIGIGCIIGIILLVNRSPITSTVDYRNPVRSAAQDEISSLPGLDYTPSFKQYSGYLGADTTNNRFLHYWLVESQSRPSDDPLVLWLNGGPGCSSLLGMFTELGPFLFDEKQEQLVKNEFAWNQHANILFLESPAGVGYSYAADGNITTNDDMSAQGNYQALISFFNKFPQFKNRSLYLTGQSYAGVYIPMLANLVDKNNTMNLKGISVGNGYFDDNLLLRSKVLFSRYHGLISSSTWNNFTTKCCQNDLDRRSSCDMGRKLNHSTQDAPIDCNNTIEKIKSTVEGLNINLYNIYAQCDSLQQTDNFNLREKIANFAHSILNKMDQIRRGVPSLNFDSSRKNLPCHGDDETLASYLNGEQMRDALHIPKQLSKQFKICWNERASYNEQYPHLPGGLTQVFQSLMQSSRKFKMLIYNGDVDLICDFIGAEWFVDNLNDTLVTDRSPWFVGKQLAGFVKQFEHITLMTVRGAGHSVPKDKPAEALHLFEKYLLGLPPSSRSKIDQQI